MHSRSERLQLVRRRSWLLACGVRKDTTSCSAASQQPGAQARFSGMLPNIRSLLSLMLTPVQIYLCVCIYILIPSLISCHFVVPCLQDAGAVVDVLANLTCLSRAKGELGQAIGENGNPITTAQQIPDKSKVLGRKLGKVGLHGHDVVRSLRPLPPDNDHLPRVPSLVRLPCARSYSR